MQRLAGTVGDGGANALQDVVLVQAILVVSSRPAKFDPRMPKYLKSYDGVCGTHTIAALRQFQDDQVFVNSAGNASQPVAGARSGLVVPDDPTWKKLCAAPPEAMRDLRAIAGSKVVYAAAPASELQVNLAALNSAEFEVVVPDEGSEPVQPHPRRLRHCHKCVSGRRAQDVPEAVRVADQRAERYACGTRREQS